MPDEEGKEHEVCKTFLLTTFGFKTKNDTMLHNILKYTPQDSLSPSQDKRGKNTPLHIDRKQIADHIESFKPSISRYRLEHAPNRR